MSHTQELSLFQLNHLVKEALETCFPESYWVRAELSEVHSSAAGHCYVEFVEKSNYNQQIIAKARGSIWANKWRELRREFEEMTGQKFVAGIKVMVQVSVSFHELYGYSLVVQDIDPSYTLGDMARNRAEILKRLEEEGVKELNKELVMPSLTRRVAVISSATAAGYGDFIDQLHNNDYDIAFYTHLFPAVMQGANTEQSIITALNKIYQHIDLFDVVIILRGGGATSDLSGFDSYNLALNCAQFPLPIITAIGHERDDTVLDLISHTRMKTPTAAAAFLLNRMYDAIAKVNELENEIVNTVNQRMEREKLLLSRLTGMIPQYIQATISNEKSKLELLKERMKMSVGIRVEREKMKLSSMEQVIELTDPNKLLAKGYTLTMLGDRVLTDASQLKRGDRVTTVFRDGSVESLVTDIKYDK